MTRWTIEFGRAEAFVVVNGATALGIEAWLASPGITAGEAFRLLEDGALEPL